MTWRTTSGMCEGFSTTLMQLSCARACRLSPEAQRLVSISSKVGVAALSQRERWMQHSHILFTYFVLLFSE